ncbi:unnamed protein product [Cyprideis torosa]|uniref:Uncharacterized protein n=1 Tax=Cyprideis torosa TaxID=163714 RepID=A0A7R8ZJ07_9CRUS|nr:unnamed protein product [Cyprideis torosa]CAG0881229.1 unnamed protein product [Cyprideis torosa]
MLKANVIAAAEIHVDGTPMGPNLPQCLVEMETGPIPEKAGRHPPKVSKKVSLPFSCNDCGAAFRTMDKRKEHMIQAHNKDHYMCPVCQRPYRSKGEILNHVKVHEINKELVFRCEEKDCTETFETYRLLKKHRQVNHGHGPFTCKYCNKAFTTSGDKQWHYSEEHASDRPFKCSECVPQYLMELETWPIPEKAGRHPPKVSKKVSLPFSCNDCGAPFRTMDKRKAHMIQAHNIGPRAYLSKHEILNHVKVHDTTSGDKQWHYSEEHASDRPFKCSECDWSLSSHRRRFHATTEMFGCNQCGKTYGAVYCLKRHIESVHNHGQRNKYVCDLCGHSFRYDSNLAKHRRSHLQEKKYKCPVCEKAFVSWDNRLVHMYTHTNLKPYQCSICSEGFPRKPQTLAHIRSKHQPEDQPETYVIRNYPFVFNNGEVAIDTNPATTNVQVSPMAPAPADHEVYYVPVDMSELAEESDALAPTTACRICRGPYSVKRERGDGEPVSTGRFKAAPSTEGSWLDLFHGLETENVEPKDRMCCKLCFKLLSDYESLREELRKIERRLSTTKKKILKRNAVGSQENVSKYPNGDDGRLDGDDWPLALDAIDEGTDMVPSDVLLVKTEVPDDFSAAEDLQNTLAAVYDERSSAGDTETETPTKKMAPVKKLLKRAREPGKPKGKRKRVKKRLPMSVKCNDCGAICVSSYQLRRHMISVHKTSYYNCPACDRQFSMWRMMKVHVSEHEARGEWLTCKKDGCTEGFATYRDLCEHRLKHHRQKYYEGNFPCKYSPPCEAVFKTQYARKIHYNESHRVERPHVCEICGDCWETRKSCQKHVSRHKKKEELDARHIESVHNHGQRNKYVCDLCGHSFRYDSNLAKHRRSHLQEKKYKCPVCEKAFVSWDNRLVHMYTHTNLKPYQCSICSEGFPRKPQTLAHIQSKHKPEDQPETARETQGKEKTSEETTADVRQVQRLWRHLCVILSTTTSLKRAREPGKPKGKRKRVKKRLPMSVKCNDCGAICVSSYQLRRHMISVHKTSYYNCPACDRQFSMWRMMKVHVSEHEARGEWLTCKKDGCTEGFATYRDLCEHRLKHHRQKYYEGNFPCKYSPPCEAVFKTQYARKIHYNESHRVERPHVCEICGDCWETRKSCQKHVSRHKKKEELDAVKKKKEEKSEAEKEAKDDAEPDPSQLIYGCPVCEMKFANRHAKARHLEEHDSTCPICGKKLSNTQTLVYHMPMHFPSQKISCEICGILFATKNNLDKHVKRHNDTTKYQCDTCGKFFNHQNSLESHIRSAHQTQEAFHCKVCGKFYGRFSDLKTHMAIVHDGSKRNVCKICGLSFKYSSGLARHRFSQHQAAKYRCQLCNKSFSSWNNRYSHMYTHTDTKPYECRICGAGYPRKPAAVAHVRSSHPDICNISTPGPDHFVKHNAPNLPDDIMKAAAEYADPQQQAARYGNVSEPTDIKSVDVKSNDDSSTIGSSTPTPQQTPLTIPWNLSTNAAPHPDSYPPSMSIPLPSMMMPGTSLLDSSHLLQFQSSLRPKE